MDNLRRNEISQCVFEEIGLGGLEGVLFKDIWRQLALQYDLTLPLEKCFMETIYQFLVQQQFLEFFILPEPRGPEATYERMFYDVSTLESITRKYPVHVFKHVPIDEDGIRGSCENYKTRKRVNREDLIKSNYMDINKRHGNRFVIVGSQKLREYVLFGDEYGACRDLKIELYYILERVGRSRYAGEFTSGQCSLIDCCTKDVMYLYRDALLQLNLVTIQNYFVKKQLLVHLPKFRVAMKHVITIITEKLFEHLKAQPDNMMDASTYEMIFNKKYRKEFIKSTMFHKIFESKTVMASTIQPDITSKFKNDTVTIWRIRDPKISIKSISEPDCSTETSDENFVNIDNIPLNMSPIEVVLDKLHIVKEQGLFKKEISDLLGISFFELRQLLKRLELNKIIHGFFVLNGKHKQMKICAIEYKDNISKTDISNIVATTDDSKIECTIEDTEEQVTELSNELVSMKHVNEVHNKEEQSDDSDVSVKILITYNLKICRKEARDNSLFDTEMGRKRAQFILSYVKEHKLVNFMEITVVVRNMEKMNGHTGIICSKSCRKLINKLANLKKFKIIWITWEYKCYIKRLGYVADLSIHKSHPILLKSINETKFEFKCEVLKKTKDMDLRKQVTDSKPEILDQPTTLYTIVSRNGEPRFIRMKYFHYCLMTIVERRYNENLLPLDKIEILKNWKKEQICEFDFDEICDEIGPIYESTLSWSTFIPPIDINKKRNERFVSRYILFRNMPLSIYMKVQNVNIKGLEKYTNHPIRKHYLINQLPECVAKALIPSEKTTLFQLPITWLCFAGLIKTEINFWPGLFRYYVYVNKNVSIIDTRDDCDSHSKRISFEMNGLNDAKNYWKQLKRICYETKSNKHILGEQNSGRLNPKRVQEKLCKVKNLRSPEEIISTDNGYIPGDGRGTAGFDSVLQSGNILLWTTQIVASKIKSRELHKLRINNQTKSKIVKKPIREPPVKFAMKSKPKIIRCKVISNAKPKPKPILKPKIIKKVSSTVALKKKKYENSVDKEALRQLKSKNKKYEDSADKEALSQLKSKRSTWRKDEDEVLFLCKLALEIMQDSFKRHLWNYSQIRDIIQWACRSMDKTSNACAARIKFLTTNLTTRRYIIIQTTELEQMASFKKFFPPDLLHRVRKLYSESDQSSVCKIHFLNLFNWLRTNGIGSMKILSDRIIPKLPLTLEQFYNKFSIHSFYKSQNEPFLFQEPKTLDDIQTATIRALIHSSMCTVQDKTSYSTQLFTVYKNYDNAVLQRAIIDLRTVQMITINSSIANATSTGPSLPVFAQALPLSTRSFRFSVQYQHKLVSNIPYSILLEMSENLIKQREELKSQPNEKHAVKLSLTSTMIFLSELLYHQLITVETKSPMQLVTLDPNGKNMNPSMTKLYEEFNKKYSLCSDSSQSPSKYATSDDMLDNSMDVDEEIGNEKFGVLNLKRQLQDKYDSNCHLHEDLVVQVSKVYMKYKNSNMIPTVFHHDLNVHQMRTNVTILGIIERVDNLNQSHIIQKLSIMAPNLTNAGIQIYNYLDECRELGAVPNTLLQIVPQKDLLIDACNALKKLNLIYRMGVNNLRYVHWKHVHAWSIETSYLLEGDKNASSAPTPKHAMTASTQKIKKRKSSSEEHSVPEKKARLSIEAKHEFFAIPYPWIRVNGTLNNRVLDKLLGVVLLQCVSNPGISLFDLGKILKFFYPVHLRHLLEILQEQSCIQLLSIPKGEIGLFTEFDSAAVEPTTATDLDNTEDIFIEVTHDAVSRLAILLSDKKYSTDFI